MTLSFPQKRESIIFVFWLGEIVKLNSFGKNRRLTKNSQFKVVLAKKNRFAGDLLVLYTAPNDQGLSRLGVSIGKSFGNAVQRNRAKRYIREAFRLNQDKIADNFDYLVMISPKKLKQDAKIIKALTFEQFQSALLELISRT